MHDCSLAAIHDQINLRPKDASRRFPLDQKYKFARRRGVLEFLRKIQSTNSTGQPRSWMWLLSNGKPIQLEQIVSENRVNDPSLPNQTMRRKQTAPPARPNQETEGVKKCLQNECIFLTHGYGAHWIIMSPIARQLRQLGYQVVNWGYRSIWSGVERHARKMRTRLQALDASQYDRLHIVAHSMGNVVTRLALQQACPPKLGRIVMLCPPNHGSHVASLYAPLFGWLSPSLRDIRDTQDSLVNQLDENLACPVDVGIIQATTDFVVKPESTRLACAQDYLMLKGFHSSVVAKRNTAEQVHYFLQNGSFRHTLDEPS